MTTSTTKTYLLMTRQVGEEGFDNMKSQVEGLIQSENRQDDVTIAHSWPGMGVLQLKCDTGFLAIVKTLTSVGNIEAERTVQAVKKPAVKGPGM